jgi:hypothetical protein
LTSVYYKKREQKRVTGRERERERERERRRKMWALRCLCGIRIRV